MIDSPAGWYPDPEHSAQLRYWDGSVWTSHTAPLPTAPTPEPEQRSRGTCVVIAIVGLVLLAGVALSIFGFVAYMNHGHPIGFLSEELAERANEVCGRHRAELPAPAEHDASNADRAAVVDASADVYEAMTAELAALPAAGDDVEVLEEWVATWESFNRVGRRYADAIRVDDPQRHDIGNEGDSLDRDLSEFASNNQMPDCAG